VRIFHPATFEVFLSFSEEMAERMAGRQRMAERDGKKRG